MAHIELSASVRPQAGKGEARRARREGRVPAIIYGDGQPPETISLDYNDLWKQVLKGHFTSTVIDLKVGGETRRVIPREVQVDPIKDQPIHVDFLRIGKDGRIRVAVPVRFINEALSPGLKRGGVLNIVRHEIEVVCPYDKIPPFFEVDLDGLQIGRSVHFSAIKLPEGITPVIRNRDFTVATIAGAVREEEPTPTEAAETPEGAAAPAASAAEAKPGAQPAAKSAEAKAPDAKPGAEKKK